MARARTIQDNIDKANVDQVQSKRLSQLSISDFVFNLPCRSVIDGPIGCCGLSCESCRKIGKIFIERFVAAAQQKVEKV